MLLSSIFFLSMEPNYGPVVSIHCSVSMCLQQIEADNINVIVHAITMKIHLAETKWGFGRGLGEK